MIKVAVFDDNKARRELLEMLLNSTADMECTGGYEDCRNVIKNIVQNIPDVVLMDIDMPHVNGIEGLQLIRKQFPQVKILMQTVFEEDDKIFAAICAGADGYILKKTPPAKLIDAITEVVSGGAPMTPTVARQVLQLFNNRNKKSATEFNLTDREHEILSMLVQGLSYKMIADKCNVSYSTVNSHISHIYEKLHVKSGTEAVAKAIEQKIV
ncbi:MAG TPA: response regulator transcription factor [Chitinophagales bacterium]|nr:response regulator transcription factor [Chitinophagales bacterium]